MKKSYVAVLLASIGLFSGCGSGSSISDTSVSYKPPTITTVEVPQEVKYVGYKIKAVDEVIVNAKVYAPECNESVELGNGEYLLKHCSKKPSFISIENGIVKDLNITQSFPLVLNVSQTKKDDNFVITPLTTLLATDMNGSDVQKIASELNLSVEDIYNDPEKLDVNITPFLHKINAIFIKAYEDGAIANKAKFLNIVREKIKENINNLDFNVTKIAQEVEMISQQKPHLFGLVFMGDLKDGKNILDEIKNLQNPSKIRFLGLVFDDKIANAKIKVYRKDTGEVLADNIQADNNGKWILELNNSWIDTIKNEDFVVILEAIKDKIKLISSTTSTKLRKKITLSKNISPSKDTDLIISNITTVENVLLDKISALNDAKSYEGNKSIIKTYYGDKILKAAAVVKGSVEEIIENNDSTILNNRNSTNTYELVQNILTVTKNEFNQDVDVNITENDIDTNKLINLEKNITNDAILSKQINGAITYEENGFEKAAKENDNVFYNVIAYFLPGNDGVIGTGDDIFRREYSEIVVLPNLYKVKTYYIDGNETTWHFLKEINSSTANFVYGKYNAVLDDENKTIISYKLDNLTELTVPEICKTYKLYGVSVMDIVYGEIKNITPEVLISSYDVIDMFRRMPKDDPQGFKDMQFTVWGKTRDEVNFEMNRYVRKKTEELYKFFSNSKDTNTTNCQ